MTDIDTLSTETRLVVVRARRAQPVHKTTARRRPWFRCLSCGRRLFQVDVQDGWTCVRVGAAYSASAFAVTCPRCGTEREFYPAHVGD